MLAFVIHNPLSGRIISQSVLRFEPVVMPAVVNLDSPSTGCLASHRKCLLIAKSLGEPNCLVIEDDCLVSESCSEEELLSGVELLDALGADILNGGVLRAVPQGELLEPFSDGKVFDRAECRLGNQFAIVGQTWSTHFVVYSERSYDKLLDGSSMPIDLLPGSLGLTTIVPLPFWATQIPGQSAIARAYMDYSSAYEQAERYLLGHGDAWNPESQPRDSVKIVLKRDQVVCINGKLVSYRAGTVEIPRNDAIILVQSGAAVESL